ESSADPIRKNLSMERAPIALARAVRARVFVWRIRLSTCHWRLSNIIDADDSPKDLAVVTAEVPDGSRRLRFLLSNYPQTGIELQRRRNSQRSATGLSAIGAQRFSSCF